MEAEGSVTADLANCFDEKVYEPGPSFSLSLCVCVPRASLRIVASRSLLFALSAPFPSPFTVCHVASIAKIVADCIPMLLPALLAQTLTALIFLIIGFL